MGGSFTFYCVERVYCGRHKLVMRGRDPMCFSTEEEAQQFASDQNASIDELGLPEGWKRSTFNVVTMVQKRRANG